MGSSRKKKEKRAAAPSAEAPVEPDETAAQTAAAIAIQARVRPLGLAIRPSELPEPKLQALWKRLDEDSSGYITAGEFGRFMKKGAAVRAAQVAQVSVPGADVVEESTRRRRLVEEGIEAKRREATRLEEERLHAAARRSAAVTRQIQLEAARLEAALPTTVPGRSKKPGRLTPVRALQPLPRPGGGWLPGMVGAMSVLDT